MNMAKPCLLPPPKISRCIPAITMILTRKEHLKQREDYPAKQAEGLPLALRLQWISNCWQGRQKNSYSWQEQAKRLRRLKIKKRSIPTSIPALPHLQVQKHIGTIFWKSSPYPRPTKALISC